MAGRSGGQRPPGWPRQRPDPIYSDLSALGEGAGFEANKTKISGMSLIMDLPGDRSQGAVLYEALILSQLRSVPEPCREAVYVGLNLLDGYPASGSGPRLTELGVREGLRLQGSDCKTARDRWTFGKGWLVNFIREEIARRTALGAWDDLLPAGEYKGAEPLAVQTMGQNGVAEGSPLPATRITDAAATLPVSPTTGQDIPFSAELSVALEGACKYCEARKRMVYVSDLLIALLEMPNRRVMECFDKVEPGLAQRTREHLYENLARTPIDRFDPFRPFSWLIFLEVRQAWKLALKEGPETKINEIHLLLGILAERSTTNQRLVTFLGAQHDELRESAETMRGTPPRPKTP